MSSDTAIGAAKRNGEAAFSRNELSDASMEKLRRPARRERLYRLLALFSPLVILLIWEIVSQLNLVDRRFFPPPSAISGTAWEMLVSLEVFEHIGATLRRIAVGYVMGAIPGIFMGLLLGVFKPVRLALGPVFSALYPVPKIAILPLILLIFGVGDMSKFVIIAIGVFFLTFYNTLSGVLQAPAIYFEVARNAGASRLQTFGRVALPAALPSVFTGLKLAAGTSYIIIAAAEFLGSRSGVGYFIWSSWQTFSITKMYTGIIVISALGYITLTLLDALERKLVPWAKH